MFLLQMKCKCWEGEKLVKKMKLEGGKYKRSYSFYQCNGCKRMRITYLNED